MISFLNTLILYALPTIAIPLIIHLFTKQKLKKVYFSSLEFLKEMRKEQIRRVKIKQILLIILRTLIILLIVLAFARPALKEQPLFSDSYAAARSAIAIILDNSMSMARTTAGVPIFDFARKRAFDLIQILKPGDEVYLLYPLRPGETKIIGPKYNFESIRQTIHSTPLSYHGTDLFAAIRKAKHVLKNSNKINREIYLLSDLQKTAFPVASDSLNNLKTEGIKLYLLPVKSSQYRNLVLTDLELVNQILERGKPAEIEAEISNHGTTDETNKLVQLFLNGKRTAQITLDLNAGATKRISFKFTPDQTGFQVGSVLLEDDDLARDNQRYFSFYVPDEINVLLTGKSERDIQFFQWALKPSPTVVTSLNPEFVPVTELNAVDMNKYHVLFLSNVPDLKASFQQKLVKFVAAGGGLVIALGTDVDIRAYNESFVEKFNLPRFTESVGQLGADSRFLSLGKIDFSHPIFHSLFEQDKNKIESPHFKFTFDVEKNPTYDVIMQYNNNNPFLIETKLEKGRILLFTTSTNPDWSDWPLKGIFAPLINRCVSYLARSSDIQTESVRLGEPIQFLGSQEFPQLELEIVTPDERQVRVRPQILQNNLNVHYNATDLPGIYQLLNQDKLIGQWAVNVDPRESDIQVLPMDDFKQYVGVEQVLAIEKEDEIETRVASLRYGKELWKLFLILALILLIVEMLIFRERVHPETAESETMMDGFEVNR